MLGQPYSWKEIYRFSLFYFVFEGNFQKYTPPPRGGLYLEGQLKGGCFASRVWGAYIWRGLYTQGLIFGILQSADLATGRERQLTTGKRAERAKHDFRFQICRSAQASCLICARCRQLTFTFPFKRCVGRTALTIAIIIFCYGKGIVTKI